MNCLRMLNTLNFFGKTSELARVFGIEFFNVLNRGSQYRVEAMLLRITKPLNFILISPTREQVARQKAPECLPLVMEPESRYYSSPVLVLDFRSLYPSIMIAYNYCYSTCLGRLSSLLHSQGASSHPGHTTTYQQAPHANNSARAPADTNRDEESIQSISLGCSELVVPKGLLGLMSDERIWLAPNDVLYARNSVRVGVLPRLLQEILDTRFMVKQAMKDLGPDDKVRHNLEYFLPSAYFLMLPS